MQLLQVNPDFRDEAGFPFGMLMPVTWLPPLEYLSMSSVYPNFDNFVASEAAQSADWYDTWVAGQVIAAPPVSDWAW